MMLKISKNQQKTEALTGSGHIEEIQSIMK